MGALSQIIKLDATDSTNLYLRSLSHAKKVPDFTVVVADKQLQGRGQMGTTWQSESGKNLTFSVLKRFGSMQAHQQFNLNICVSLAVYDVLNALFIPNIKVKWPNDIMSGSSKICGILIENVLKGQHIQHTIIGIGLNVNQTSFKGLDNVGSLHMLMGRSFNLDELLHNLLSRLRFHLKNIESKTENQLLPSYESLLYRKDKPSTFKDKDQQVFMGFIRGVSPQGMLILELEDKVFKEFGLKEVSLLT